MSEKKMGVVCATLYYSLIKNTAKRNMSGPVCGPEACDNFLIYSARDQWRAPLLSSSNWYDSTL